MVLSFLIEGGVIQRAMYCSEFPRSDTASMLEARGWHTNLEKGTEVA
jgi:hypothetical protein